MTELRVAAHKEIPSCFYDLSTVYGFSLAPNDDTQCYGDKTGNRLSLVVERVRSNLTRILKPYAKYVLITEVSEPRETRKDVGYPRIHFHGVIAFKNPIRYLTESLHRLGLFSSVVISPYDAAYWDRYMLKQKYLMAPELGNAYYLSDRDTSVTVHGPTDHVVSRPASIEAPASRNPCDSEAYRVGVRSNAVDCELNTFSAPTVSYSPRTQTWKFGDELNY